MFISVPDRIRIRPKVSDPYGSGSGSGSTTLEKILNSAAFNQWVYEKVIIKKKEIKVQHSTLYYQQIKLNIKKDLQRWAQMVEKKNFDANNRSNQEKKERIDCLITMVWPSEKLTILHTGTEINFCIGEKPALFLYRNDRLLLAD